jgi:hypothetical protein
MFPSNYSEGLYQCLKFRCFFEIGVAPSVRSEVCCHCIFVSITDALFVSDIVKKHGKGIVVHAPLIRNNLTPR